MDALRPHTEEMLRAGSSLSSTLSHRAGAGLAALACSLLLLGALNATPLPLTRKAPQGGLSSFTLLPPPPPKPLFRETPPHRPDLSRQAASRTDRQPALARAAEIALPTASPLPMPSLPTASQSPPLAAGKAPAQQAVLDKIDHGKADDDKVDQALTLYQRALWDRIAARRPAGVHLSGVAMIGFTLSAEGSLISAELAASSGNAMLDRLALRTIRNASPFPPPPQSVAKDRLTFTIAFSFH